MKSVHQQLGEERHVIIESIKQTLGSLIESFNELENYKLTNVSTLKKEVEQLKLFKARYIKEDVLLQDLLKNFDEIRRRS